MRCITNADPKELDYFKVANLINKLNQPYIYRRIYGCFNCVQSFSVLYSFWVADNVMAVM